METLVTRPQFERNMPPRVRQQCLQLRCRRSADDRPVEADVRQQAAPRAEPDGVPLPRVLVPEPGDDAHDDDYQR